MKLPQYRMRSHLVGHKVKFYIERKTVIGWRKVCKMSIIERVMRKLTKKPKYYDTWAEAYQVMNRLRGINLHK